MFEKPDLDAPESRAAAHFMDRKGYDVAPLAVEPIEGELLWYFYYDVDGSLLELEVEYLEGDWFTAVTDMRSSRELGTSPAKFVQQSMLTVET